MSNVAIRLYNTMTQRLEPFEPLEPGHVSVYMCGLTPYDHAHAATRGRRRVRRARPLLRARGYRVTYVRNVTDVDDKILKRAARAGRAPLELLARMALNNADELRGSAASTRTRAAGLREHRRDRRAHREAHRQGRRLRGGPRRRGATSTSRCAPFPAYGKLSRRNVDDLLSARASRPARTSATRSTSPCGRRAATTAGAGTARGARAARVAHRVLGHGRARSRRTSTSTAAGMDSSSPTTRTRSRRARPRRASPSRASGSTRASSTSTTRRWQVARQLRHDPQILARNDAEALRYFLLGAHYRGPIELRHREARDGRVVFPGVDEAERRMEYLYATREALGRGGRGAARAVGDDPDREDRARGARAGSVGARQRPEHVRRPERRRRAGARRQRNRVQ